MELTVDLALKKGIDAHKAGQYQEADRFYTAILNSYPEHADANHNMGILAVNIQKITESLFFFRAALNANPSVAQFWLSYIDALTKLGRISDAKAALDEAKSAGMSRSVIDQLKVRFSEIIEDVAVVKVDEPQEPSGDQLQSLLNLYQNGMHDEVLAQAIRLLKDFKKSSNLNNLIGASFSSLGKFDQAVNAYQKAISINSENSTAYYNLGAAFTNQGKLGNAIEVYNKAIALNPDYAEAYNNKGAVLARLAKLDGALEAYNKAITLKPDYADVYNNKGAALAYLGKFDEAIESYNKAITLKPDYADVYNNKGAALAYLGKLDEAIGSYDKAIALKPDYAEAFNNKGAALKRQEKLEEAIAAYEKSISIKPDYAEAYNNMGNAYQDLDKLGEAIRAYKLATKLNANYHIAYNNMGHAFQMQNKLNEAKLCYKKAVSLKPDFTEAHRNLTLIHEYTLDDPHLSELQRILEREKLNDKDKCQINFALAKIYDDLGEFDKAFEHLSLGNHLRKKLLNYSFSDDVKLFKKFEKTQPIFACSPIKFDRNPDGISPIFIIGMPRSGTTLVEQIISSHSDIRGGGELNYVVEYGLDLAIGKKHINNLNLNTFRANYLARLLSSSSSEKFITDKMPHNFRFLPLICAAFPEAKIIHVHRNAKAICWSNFKHYFVDDSMGYSCDLNDVVAYYKLYKHLINLWESHYGKRIYNLDYDKLVQQQEFETKRLIAHLGLTWEAACLSPHENDRSVKTASQHQVRKKIYTGSSEAWRKYEPYICDALDSLHHQ